MPNAVELAAWAGMLLLAAFVGVVGWKLFTGEIDMDYLLYGDARTRGGGTRPFFSAGRTQMLMVTVGFASYYVLQVIQDPTKFPEVPNAMLVTLGGSHAIYLGGKAQALYWGRLRDLADAVLNGRRP